MQPLDDYPIGSGHGTSPPPREGTWRLWAITALCFVVAAVAVVFFMRRSNTTDDAATGGPAPSVRQDVPRARGPLGPAVEPRELPPLDLMDPFVRELLTGLSSRPELAAWLATDGLVRNIVVSVDAVANGTTPSRHLRRLAPSRPFIAEPRGEEFVIDPRSYRRYDGIADTVAAVDADGVARAYATLRPRLQEAYRELGYPDGNFDEAVERAIARLLGTRLLEEDVDVRPAPVLYKFADERIERLTPAQKQLLRMGPRNARLVQDKLRDVAQALGIPPERLP
jgi:hypothetical protein